MWFKRSKQKSGASLFTPEWIDEWKTSINNSVNYKNHGKGWNAPLILKFDPVPDLLNKNNAIGFYLDLHRGECEELRYATEKDLPACDVVLTADEKTWLRLMNKKSDPTMMIMKGSLKMEKGSLVLLSIQRKAAKALMETAPVSDNISAELPGSEEHKLKLNGGVYHRKEFRTTKQGLDFESFPMQLFQKSKILGVWDPADIDLSGDKKQWQNLRADEKEILVHLSSLFMAGEEAVTLELLPLIRVVAKEGRIEEEIYLTSFLWEEAKHTEFFSRYVQQVMVENPDFEAFHKPFYKKLFYEKLPDTLNRLETDASPLAQLKAAGTYNMIVEGTLAETGYEAYYKMLRENDLLPGLQEGISNLKKDEARHIAFGLYFLNRILEQNPSLKGAFESHLSELLNDVTNIIHEIFEPYDVVPFGLEKEWFLDYAIKQFQNRVYKLGL